MPVLIRAFAVVLGVTVAIVIVASITGHGCNMEDKIKEAVVTEVDEEIGALEERIDETLAEKQAELFLSMEAAQNKLSSDLAKERSKAIETLAAKQAEATEQIAASVRSIEEQSEKLEKHRSDTMQVVAAQTEALKEHASYTEQIFSEAAGTLEAVTARAQIFDLSLGEKIAQTEEIQANLAAVETALEERVTWVQTLLIVLGVLVGLGLCRTLLWPTLYLLVRCSERIRGRRSSRTLEGGSWSPPSGARSDAAQGMSRVYIETKATESIYCFPGVIAGLEGSVEWTTPLVGNFMQWFKRGVAFLDAFRGKGRIILLPPGPMESREIDVHADESWEVNSTAFLASEGRAPRFRFHASLMRVLARKTFSRFEFVGPGKLWIRGMPGLVGVELPPGESVVIPMANVAAYPDQIRIEYLALPLRHAMLGRGVFLARLVNGSEDPTSIYLQGLQGLAGQAGPAAQGGGVFSYVWDVSQHIIPG